LFRSDRRLEHLHRGPDQVEESDHAHLPQALQAQGEHRDLHRDRREDERVGASERRIVRVQHSRGHQQHEHHRSEHARPGLLEAEHDELDEAGPPHPARGREGRGAALRPPIDPLLERGEGDTVRGHPPSLVARCAGPRETSWAFRGEDGELLRSRADGGGAVVVGPDAAPRAYDERMSSDDTTYTDPLLALGELVAEHGIRVVVSDLDGVLRVFDASLWDELDAMTGTPDGTSFRAVLGHPYLDDVVRGRGTHARW